MRKLSIKKETIRVLDEKKLTAAVGGMAISRQCPSNYCVPFTEACITDNCGSRFC